MLLENKNEVLNFNKYRFSGFNYKKFNDLYWQFNNQINDDQSKIILQVANSNLYAFYSKYEDAPMYIFKLDQQHFVYLKSWQILKGKDGTYLVLDRSYWHVKRSKTPFVDMVKEANCTWRSELNRARAQFVNRSQNLLISRFGTAMHIKGQKNFF